MNIAYVCDRKACGENCVFPKCQHTEDINHALNFEKIDENKFIEAIEFTFTDISEDKKQVIENLKKYKQTGSRTTISEDLDLHVNAYTLSDILSIIMGGPYCTSTGEIIQRLIDLLEA